MSIYRQKTIPVEELVRTINHLLATHTSTPDYALGLIVALEQILNQTNNYRGYQYLEQHEVPKGFQPGIIWEEGQQGRKEATFLNTDPTRVRYY